MTTDNITTGAESNGHRIKSMSVPAEDIALAIEKVIVSCKNEAFFDPSDPRPIPSQEAIIEAIQQAKHIFFPGHVAQTTPDPVSLEHYLREEAKGLFKNLSKQIAVAIQHGGSTPNRDIEWCARRGSEIARQFIHLLSDLRGILVTDVRAALGGDPAAKSFDEIIFSYPGLLAITVYRMAHELHEMAVPFVPRMMTEHAHSLTGIDIHPGAKIGRSFFIDHGTGVVIGETTEIGDRVRIYQGVTLGALSIPRDDVESFRDKKRHPTIEDDVIIYSNATILGGGAVIGARSIIGGNVWIIDSVPPDTKVLLKKPELVYIGNKTEGGSPGRSTDQAKSSGLV